jgi:hypothetical protein
MDDAGPQTSVRAEDPGRPDLVALWAEFDAGNHAAVTAALASADPAFRATPKVRVLAARLMLAKKRPAEAEAECRRIDEGHATFIDHLPPFCRALLLQGRAAEARDLFATRVWTGSFSPELCARLIAELTQDCSPADLVAFTARLDALRTPTLTEQSRMAHEELRLGQNQSAIRRLEAIEQGSGLTPLQKSQLLRALIQIGQKDRALQRAASWQSQSPDDPQESNREASTLLSSGNEALSVARTLDSLASWPLDDGLLLHLLRMIVPAEACARLLDESAAARQASPLSAAAVLAYAVIALQARRTGTALEILAAHETTEKAQGHDLSIRQLLAVLKTRPVEAWDNARFRDDGQSHMQVVRSAGARATVLVLPGQHRKLALLPLESADVLLARHPVNVIYARDTRNTAFLRPGRRSAGRPRGLSARSAVWSPISAVCR